MSITADTVHAWNAAQARLALDPRRDEELPVELNQLSRAIEAVRDRVDFDVDPFDFRVALAEHIRERP